MKQADLEKQILVNYIKCSGCEYVLECQERGKHDNCIKYKPKTEGGD